MCLRAERDGGKPEGRTYTVVLEARDPSGDAQRLRVPVRVPHDQRRSTRCTTGDRVPTVDDDDPRCSASVPVTAGAPAATPLPSGEGDEGGSASSLRGGCSATGEGPVGAAWLMAVFVVWAARRGRSRQRGSRR